jgi:hypothetical protein
MIARLKPFLFFAAALIFLVLTAPVNHSEAEDAYYYSRMGRLHDQGAQPLRFFAQHARGMGVHGHGQSGLGFGPVNRGMGGRIHNHIRARLDQPCRQAGGGMRWQRQLAHITGSQGQFWLAAQQRQLVAGQRTLAAQLGLRAVRISPLVVNRNLPWTRDMQFRVGDRARVEALAAELQRARRLGRSLADPAVLARYERTHWLASRPTYLATQLVAGLYTSESAPARLARHVALRIGQKLTPFRQVVAASLTGA